MRFEFSEGGRDQAATRPQGIIPGMSDWLSCLWTTVWATNAATANGWAGIVIGLAIGIALSFHPVFRFPNKPYLDNTVGKLVVIICTFTGVLAGELAGVASAGVC